MASDFSVAWQCLSNRTIGFSLQIKLHAPRSWNVYFWGFSIDTIAIL
jgi:hypothetical protein